MEFFEVMEQMGLIGKAIPEDSILNVKPGAQSVTPQKLVTHQTGKCLGRQAHVGLKQPLQLPGAHMKASAQLLHAQAAPAAEKLPGGLEQGFAAPVQAETGTAAACPAACARPSQGGLGLP